VMLVGGGFSLMQLLYTNIVAYVRAEAGEKPAYPPGLKPCGVRRALTVTLFDVGRGRW
jgi:hypothetical protein